MRKVLSLPLVLCLLVGCSHPAAAVHQHKKPKPQRPIVCKAAPATLLHDIALAQAVHFPRLDTMYMSRTHHQRRWTSHSASAHTARAFTVYTGKVRLAEIKNQLIERTGPCYKLRPVTISEKLHGRWRTVSATSLSLSNGAYLGFAKDQVITTSWHAGFVVYEVIPVSGIKPL